MISILTIYILIGLTLAFVVISTDEHKTDSKLEKFVLFLTMTFFWLIGLIFPIRTEKKIEVDTGFFYPDGSKVFEGDVIVVNVEAPYESDSFAKGTSKFTVVEV